MSYMKNHFQREIWLMLFGPFGVILFAMFLFNFRYAQPLDLIGASLAGLITSIIANMIMKTFSHALILSIFLTLTVVLITSSFLTGLFSRGVITITILALPSCLITTWAFLKFRQKRERVKDKIA